MQRAIFDPYMRRIEQRHGLTRNMNQKLRSYPIMVEMIRRTVLLLAQMEGLYEWAGTVRMTRQQIYRHLITACDDLVREVAVTARGTGAVSFERRPRYPYPVFNEAMSIAKHVGLIAGHGRCVLHPDILRRLRREADTEAV